MTIETLAVQAPTTRGTQLTLRRGQAPDASAILALVQSNLEAGHLLPRTLEEVRLHASRFLVIEDAGDVVACAELAPLSRLVAEVRSLVVSSRYRHRGLGTSLLEALKEWARRDGFETLCAFAHEPSVFIRLGFSTVPHQWVPEKITTDCVGCPKFRSCGQYALALPLSEDTRTGVAAGHIRSSSLPPHARTAAEPPTGVLMVRR